MKDREITIQETADKINNIEINNLKDVYWYDVLGGYVCRSIRLLVEKITDKRLKPFVIDAVLNEWELERHRDNCIGAGDGFKSYCQFLKGLLNEYDSFDIDAILAREKTEQVNIDEAMQKAGLVKSNLATDETCGILRNFTGNKQADTGTKQPQQVEKTTKTDNTLAINEYPQESKNIKVSVEELYNMCKTQEFKTDISQLSEKLKNGILEWIEGQIVFNVKERYSTAPSSIFEYIRAEQESAQNAMRDLSNASKRVGANIPHITVNYIWNKERMKALEKFKNEIENNNTPQPPKQTASEQQQKPDKFKITKEQETLLLQNFDFWNEKGNNREGTVNIFNNIKKMDFMNMIENADFSTFKKNVVRVKYNIFVLTRVMGNEWGECACRKLKPTFTLKDARKNIKFNEFDKLNEMFLP